MSSFDVAAAHAIARMNDPARRNLRITHTYHALTRAFAAALGPDDVVWPAYATWASSTAGRFIRGEAWPALLRRGASRGDRIAAVCRRIGECVAQGNQLVFAELGPLYIRLLAALTGPRALRDARRAALLDALRPGPVEVGGQDMLRRAFAAYFEVAELRAPKRRAERMLLANALVGLHEQTRLQSTIAAAFDAPRALLLEGLPRRAMQPLRRLATRWCLQLELPGVALSLGRDVPRLPGGEMFPRALREIRDPELQSLLARLDRTPDTTCGSAAADWSDLGDRMNYLVDLFRSRQQDPRLYARPRELAAA